MSTFSYLDSRQPPVTQKQHPVTLKQLPSLALGNDFQEMNAAELPEAMATAGSCSGLLAIVEETLTSDEYVSLFLISILNMNI